MVFKYCPACGERLSSRVIGQEGAVPFCPGCQRPWFPLFPSAVCVLGVNSRGEALFARQERIPGLCLISGFIKPGETAEETALREWREETGLSLSRLRSVGTHWYARDGVLMHLFTGDTQDGPVHPSEELLDAFFLPIPDALPRIDPSSTGVLALIRAVSEPG